MIGKEIPMRPDDEMLTVLLSTSVFPATSDEAFDGYVAIRGNRIESVGFRTEADPYTEAADEVVELGNRAVMPGLVDVHTFFTGWALRRSGCDCTQVSSTEDGIDILKARRADSPVAGLILGHGLKREIVSSLSEKSSPRHFLTYPLLSSQATAARVG